MYMSYFSHLSVVCILSLLFLPLFDVVTLCRLSQPCWLVRSTNHDQPLYLVSEHVLAVATYNISQEEFVSKVSRTMSVCVCVCSRVIELYRVL